MNRSLHGRGPKPPPILSTPLLPKFPSSSCPCRAKGKGNPLLPPWTVAGRRSHKEVQGSLHFWGNSLGPPVFSKTRRCSNFFKNQKQNHAFNLPPLNRVRGSPSLKIKRWQFATASFLIFIEVSRSHCAALQGKQEGNNPRKQGTSTGCNPTNKQPLGSRLSPRVA